MQEETKVGYREILKQKEFMKKVIGTVIDRFGDSVDAIAFTWLAYLVTGSAAWSAILYGVNRLPGVFIQPFSGAWVEGMNKKKIMVMANVIRGLCVAAIGAAYVTECLSPWILIGIMFVISTVETFSSPAASAILPQLLDKKYYDFGLSLSSSIGSVVELIGTALGGVIIAVFGITGALCIDLVTFVLSAMIFASLKVKEEKKAVGKANVSEYLETLKDGIRYVRKDNWIMYFIMFCLFLNGILVPLNSLQAPLVEEVLHSDETMLSVIGVGFTIGSLLGSVLYPYIREKLGQRAIVSISGFGIGFLYLGIVLCGEYIENSLLMSLAVGGLMTVGGVLIAIMLSLLSIEVMKRTEEAYVARVISLLNAGAMAAAPVVSFMIGGLAKTFSTGQIFLAAAVIEFVGCMYFCNTKQMRESSKEEKEVACAL